MQLRVVFFQQTATTARAHKLYVGPTSGFFFFLISWQQCYVYKKVESKKPLQTETTIVKVKT